ncbi:phage holin family protein [Halomonas sp. DP8Y7-3]|uniref:phage holin family protein n=1 Tax=Halomonas sp. DP8Y7-3 TaxID=2859079 RepID=UPI001C94398D|nr:phage holin family protein [Halomonas sp. DP8Y7-3]MBY5930685.1 phage holin family protein [Halomonas sp. DP8Y7-3]
MSDSQGPAQRLFGAGKRVLSSLIATGETRLRLAVLELEEERARLVTMALLLGLSMVLVMLGIATLTAFVIIVFWDSYRLTAIAVSAAVLLLSGVGMALVAMRMARQRTLLVSTLKHLALDRELAESSLNDDPGAHRDMRGPSA